MADDTREQTGPAEGLGQVRHLARQSTLLLSSGVVAYVGSFGLYVMLARGLGQAGFGAWVVAFSLANTLATFGLIGADWIVLRHGAYYAGIGDTGRLRKTIHLSLWLGGTALGALGAGLVLLAPLVAREAFHTPSITSMLRVVGLMAPVMGVTQVMLFSTQAFKSMREAALIRNILLPACRLLCAALALLITATEFSAVVGVLLAEVLIMVSATYALNRRIPLIGPTDQIEQSELVRFALPAWGTRLLDQTRTQLFPLLLGILAAFSASGAFAASQRVAGATGAVIATLNQVYKPMGSDLFLQGRREELLALFKSLGKWSFALGFPLFCLQVAFPEEVLSLFGKDFRDSELILVLLAMGMLFTFATGPVATTLIMTGRARLAFWDHVVVVIAEIGLGLWLIPTLGVLGAAIARAAGSTINNLVRLAQVWWLHDLHPYRLDYWKPIAAGAGAVALAKASILMTGLGPGVMAAGVAGIVLGIGYAVLLLVFGLSDDDRAAVEAVLGGVRRRRPAAA